jgi:hypothetical protein
VKIYGCGAFVILKIGGGNISSQRYLCDFEKEGLIMFLCCPLPPLGEGFFIKKREVEPLLAWKPSLK